MERKKTRWCCCARIHTCVRVYTPRWSLLRCPSPQRWPTLDKRQAGLMEFRACLHCQSRSRLVFLLSLPVCDVVFYHVLCNSFCFRTRCACPLKRPLTHAHGGWVCVLSTPHSVVSCLCIDRCSRQTHAYTHTHTHLSSSFVFFALLRVCVCIPPATPVSGFYRLSL